MGAVPQIHIRKKGLLDVIRKTLASCSALLIPSSPGHCTEQTQPKHVFKFCFIWLSLLFNILGYSYLLFNMSAVSEKWLDDPAGRPS